MKTKDLYYIIFRIFGLYLLISTLSYYLPLISSLSYETNAYAMAIALIIPLGIVLGIIYFILVKTEKTVTFFKLLKGHSENNVLMITFDESTIFKLAIVIISLYLFVTNLPVFLYQSFSFFQSQKHEYSGLLETFGVAIYFEFYTWVMALSNLMIAYLLFSNYHYISIFLSKKIVEKEPEALDDFTNE